MLNKVFDKDKAKDYRHNSSNMQYYSEYTMIGGMYANLLESRIFEPDDYDKAELAKILKSMIKKKQKILGKKLILLLLFQKVFLILV